MTRLPHTCPKIPVVNMVRFRDRRGYLVAVATAALLAVAQVTAEGSECVNNCVAISECPEMVALLKTDNIGAIREVSKATCGVTSQGPKVCCPSTTTPVPPTTPPAPPTTPPAPGQLGSLIRDCGKSQHDKVLGGEHAPINAYPWRAILGYHSTDGTDVQWNCGGSIINDRYILTAAHCVNPGFLKKQEYTLVTVRLGEWDLNKTEDCAGNRCNPPVQDFGIEEVIEHPDFNNVQTITNDIAIIRLNRTIDFLASSGALAAVCLPPPEYNPSQALVERGAIVAGWGLGEKGFQSPVLEHFILPFVSKDKCTKVYGNRLIASQVCMGGEAGKDSCRGDSGGPLMMSGPGGRYLQVGIVSFRPAACGLEGVPGIYTATRHYRKWIEENIFV